MRHRCSIKSLTSISPVVSEEKVFLKVWTTMTTNDRQQTTGILSGVKLQGDWGKIVVLEDSKSPWEAQKVTKTSPSVFATFEKASICAKRTFCLEKSGKN